MQRNIDCSLLPYPGSRCKMGGVLKPVAVAVVLLLTLSACGDDKPPAANTAKIPTWAKVAPEQIAEAMKQGVPAAFENDIGMRFVLIPAGTFLMGPPDEEHQFRYPRGSRQSKIESPQHRVTLTQAHYMQVTEVTNAQYRAWKPKHSSGTYDEHPLDADRQGVGA